jgi:hypothetical protein
MKPSARSASLGGSRDSTPHSSATPRERGRAKEKRVGSGSWAWVLKRYGIVAALMPRVTASYATYREPTSTQHSKSTDRFQRVVRATGIETAFRPEHRTQRPLIDADQELGNEAHCFLTLSHNAARLARRSALVAPRARDRALTIRSTGGISSWLNRNDSRICRRMRLRSTELPAIFTATANPTRGRPALLGLTVTEKNPSPSRRPFAYAASNCDFRRKRSSAGSVSRWVSIRSAFNWRASFPRRLGAGPSYQRAPEAGAA